MANRKQVTVAEQAVQLIGLKPAAARLGISHHTLRAWSVYQRRVPFVKIGRRLLYDERDLRALAERGRVQALER